MHPFFDPLDARESMLLMTTLMAGSSEMQIFDRLEESQRARLQEKAQALLAIPADKRVSFMVHEIKEALNVGGARGIERVDVSWLLSGLKGESARVVAAVLIGLPTQVVRSVVDNLPAGIRQRLPAKEDMRKVAPELVSAVRGIFEARFSPMPRGSAKGFGFRDIIQLERADIYRLMRDLGLVELGQAFASVGKMALAELCRRLPREKAEELVMAVRTASSLDAPNLKSAQRFLSRVVVNFEDTEEFFQKAGLWRLAKAGLLEDPGFRTGFRQRLPREAGQLFENFVEKAGEMEELNEEVLKRLQDSIVLRVRTLAKRGEISASWAQVELNLHDRTAAEEKAPQSEEKPGP